MGRVLGVYHSSPPTPQNFGLPNKVVCQENMFWETIFFGGKQLSGTSKISWGQWSIQADLVEWWSPVFREGVGNVWVYSVCNDTRLKNYHNFRLEHIVSTISFYHQIINRSFLCKKFAYWAFTAWKLHLQMTVSFVHTSHVVHSM